MSTMPLVAAQTRTLADELYAPAADVARKLLIFACVSLLVIAAWATLVPIASGAVASGRLDIQDRRKTVQHLDGGIVRRIAIAEGQFVKRGAILIGLNDGDARLDVAVLQSQVDSLRAEKAAREAELVGAGQIRFPDDLVARASDPAVAAVLAAQRAAFAARRNSASGHRLQIGERIEQYSQDRSGAAAQMQARAAQIALLDSEIRDVASLVERGYATRTRLYSLQRAVAALRGERDALVRQGASLSAQRAQARIEIDQVERERGTDAADALRSIQNELVQVLEKLTAARQVLERKVIRAPVAGKVVDLKVTTVGGVIRPGEALMDIVPAARRLIVRARISPLHADDVRVGQTAFVRFQGLGSKNTPTLEGNVVEISADALADPRTGENYFEALVALPAATPEMLPAGDFRPGLPAEVLIRTGERTALAYMLAPISRAAFHSMRE